MSDRFITVYVETVSSKEVGGREIAHLKGALSAVSLYLYLVVFSFSFFFTCAMTINLSIQFNSIQFIQDLETSCNQNLSSSFK